ncbi:MAG: hypothetical protein MJ094_06605 [Saccharofermentans sp.]|nr:hypothetical protein [Saccharofermentans sp.]
MKVRDITLLLKDYMLKDYSVDKLSLCYMKDGSIIPSDMYVYETSLMNGDTVLLM